MADSTASPVGGYLTAFVIGALTGAGIALLYAPRTGKETRSLLAERVRKLKGKAQEGLEDAKDFIKSERDGLSAAFAAAKDGENEGLPSHPRRI